METMFPKEKYDKIDDSPVPPGFWIGAVITIALLYLIQQCTGL